MADAGSTHNDAPAELLALAESLLGDRDRATGWMSAPNFALGAATPLGALRTEGGREHVPRVLGVIAYGGVV